MGWIGCGWWLQNSTQDFNFFNCHGCQTFILAEAEANYWGFFNPRDEEISIPENHGPFGNCIPVWIYICANWASHIVLTFFFKKIMKLSQFAINFMIFSKKIVKTWRFTEFLHGGSCGNQISAWGVMQKSDSFSVVLWRFHEFFYRYRNLSMAIAYIDSYRNNYFFDSI